MAPKHVRHSFSENSDDDSECFSEEEMPKKSKKSKSNSKKSVAAPKIAKYTSQNCLVNLISSGKVPTKPTFVKYTATFEVGPKKKKVSITFQNRDLPYVETRFSDGIGLSEFGCEDAKTILIESEELECSIDGQKEANVMDQRDCMTFLEEAGIFKIFFNLIEFCRFGAQFCGFMVGILRR